MARTRTLGTARLVLGVTAAFALLTTTPAGATLRTWINAAGGSAGTSTNWSPNGVPGASDNLRYDLAANYAVSFPASVPLVINHNFVGGVVNVSATGTHTSTQSTSIGASTTAAVNMTGGTFVARSLYLGLSGGYGRLSLVPAGLVTQPPTFRTTDPTQPCDCGGTGTGRIDVLKGSLLDAGGYVSLGTFAAGLCTLSVSGRFIPTFTGARLVSNGVANIGAQGTGIMNVDDAGFVHIMGDMGVGRAANSDGAVHLGAGAGSGTPRIAAEQDLFIGESGTNSAGGTALVHVQKGTFRVGGATYLGDFDGSTGPTPRLRLEGGAFIASNGFYNQNAAYAHTGGIFHVLGGPMEFSNFLSVEGAGDPELWIGNGLTTQLTNGIDIGQHSPGLMRVVRPGTQVETTDILNIGTQVGGEGVVIADSGAVLIVGNRIVSGSSVPGPTGSLSVLGGSRVEAPYAQFWSGPASGGLVLDGTQSALVCSTTVMLNTTAFVQFGARIEVTDGDVHVREDADVAVHGGTIMASEDIPVLGTLELESGALETPEVFVNDIGTLAGNGSLSGRLICYGTLDPHSDSGLGTISVDSTANLALDAVLDIRLGYSGGPINDALVVSQALGCGFTNTTLALSAHPSFQRVPDDTFVVATAANVGGSFANVTWNGSPAGGLFDVVYEPTRVLVIVTDATVGVEPESRHASLRFAPLPGGSQLAFTLELPEDADVRAAVYDVGGRLVAHLHHGRLAAGTHRLATDVRSLPSGIYFARADVVSAVRRDARTVRTVRLR